MIDILICGGMVVDGTGKPAEKVSVAIVGENIDAVGNLGQIEAKTIINADGLIVAPGFIDVHNHAHNEMDGGILNIPDADNMIRQGVTTVVAGNCGGSSFPMRKHLDAVEKVDIRQNYSTLVGYNTIRREALKESGHRNPDSNDKKRMSELLAQSLDEGAIGMSTGMPSASFGADEISSVIRPLVERGRTCASHIRSEGRHCLEAIAELLEVGERTGASVQISHLKTFGPPGWDKLEQMFDMIEKARSRGVDVLCDRYPYIGAFSGLQRLMPGWAWTWANEHGGRESLKSNDVPKKLHEEINENIADIGGADRIVFAPLVPVPEIDGKTVAQVAAEENKSHPEVVIHWILHGGISVIWLAMREDNLQAILKHPMVMVASDGHLRVFGKGISHPRNFGTFPRVLGKYVREEKLFSIEEGIHKMTAMPAKKLGFKDRGIIKKGLIADLVVFDQENVIDKATFENGSQYPVGIKYVIVNGKIAVENEKTTSEKAGKILRA
ncbi:D-aminoacylase [bacterium]|nr:D-aminoacylase [bacterium]